ncbi:MAG: fused response regulator/phosphatase [Verrucomicrobia bacterium]|jgi:serine phosphatase RsbU (regulator of sigma subunit)|nr:fused response regulator/phosphatase [Verrucomicrobiota bacterium]
MQGQRIELVVIEDDEEDYIITRGLLDESEQERFHIQWAQTLHDGLGLLSDEVDAVLLDLSLPDSVGWETFASVHETAPHVAAILLTGLSDEELGSRAIHEGAQDYLVKGSMDSQLLCRAIRYAIERKQIEIRLSEIANELRARNAQMDTELAMAREMQLALMPRRYPDFPASAPRGGTAIAFCHHYRPCLELGGDFFDIFPVSETSVAVLICDVMGHGVQPALVTAVIRGLVEELGAQAHNPGLLLTSLNADLTRLLRQPDQLIFVSSACVTVDVKTGGMFWANAGHPAPAVVRACGGPIERLGQPPGTHAPAMGIDESSTYETYEGLLGVGDRLVLYTDGLYEVIDGEGEEFGEERLVAAMQPGGALLLEDMIRGVLDRVEAHAGTGDLDDDVCIVGLEVKRVEA